MTPSSFIKGKSVFARRWIVTCALALVFLVTELPFGKQSAFAPVSGISEANAQEARKKRRSLFNILFGKRKVRKKQVKKRAKRSTRKKKAKRSRKSNRKTAKRSSTARSAAAASAAAPVVVEKLENAKTVLVIGDFFASGLADGLEVALAPDAGLIVVDKSSGSSGLVRSDIVNWPQRAGELIKEVNPDYVVMMVGSNDRQLLREDGKRLKKQTPQWDEAYQKRVKALSYALKYI